MALLPLGSTCFLAGFAVYRFRQDRRLGFGFRFAKVRLLALCCLVAFGIVTSIAMIFTTNSNLLLMVMVGLVTAPVLLLALAMTWVKYYLLNPGHE